MAKARTTVQHHHHRPHAAALGHRPPSAAAPRTDGSTRAPLKPSSSYNTTSARVSVFWRSLRGNQEGAGNQDTVSAVPASTAPRASPQQTR